MKSQEPSSSKSTERSVPDRFERFDLQIENLGEIYRAHLLESVVGSRSPVTIRPEQLDFDALPRGDTATATRDVGRQTIERDDLRRLGEGLFRAVFVGAIGEAFRKSVERVRNSGRGLRIRIFLDAAPELATLPWEALWDPTERVFLADAPDLPVVRALKVPAETPTLKPLQAPLRLLALLPEPRGEQKLSSQSEWDQIQKDLAPLAEQGALLAERLKPPTLEALGQRIDQNPCHVLHIVAHGGPGNRGSGGLLKLEDSVGCTDPTSGLELARAFERREAPRLVVLNACHGARAGMNDAFDGMAQHLLSRGIPAVIAMRAAISDAAAVDFATALYRELALGHSIEAAMVQARRGLSLGKHRAEWATPVLYLRGENVRVFALDGRPNTVSSSPPQRAGFPPRKALGAMAAFALLGSMFWFTTDTETDSGPCPSFPELQDLHFVEIDVGVVDLGEKKIIVDQAFCISTKEVSRRDWQKITGEELPRQEWPKDWPMTDRTPESAGEFLDRLAARDPDAIYRLPTRDEWRLAARAGTASEYFFGDTSDQLHLYGNCRNFLGKDTADGPAPVGSYKPNAWGLYDVHGNVAEWVLWPEEEGTPLDEKGRLRAFRLGGSYGNTPSNCTSSSERSVIAIARDDTGFRIVREIEKEEGE
jgi:hypothetical protein